jgi:hypothetical protein
MATMSDRVPRAVTVVEAYRNLQTGTWSAKAVQAPASLKGKVVAHPSSLVLTDCEFRVSASGRVKVRTSETRQRTPCALSGRWPASSGSAASALRWCRALAR